MVKVEINYKVKTPQKYGALFEKIAKKTARKLKKKNLDISVAIVSPLEIKKMNKKYRALDKVTDVLSYNDLNEIVICLAQAKKQAGENNNSVKREMTFLFLHGLLHLLGFDHKTKLEMKKMDEISGKIL